MKRSLLKEEGRISIQKPATDAVLDNLLKSMYDSSIKLQDIQDQYPSPLARVAVMGMSSDVSEMLKRFRKISSALKTGSDERIKTAMMEANLRKLIGQLITEELKRKK